MAENNTNEQNLLKLQHLFEVDTRLKKEMYDMVPPSDEGFIDERSIIEYTDKLDDSLKYIFTELKCISNDFLGPYGLEKATIIEDVTKQEFYRAGFDLHKLREFYKNNISNMSKEFIDSVQDNCVGYQMIRSIGIPLKKVRTANELLHLAHAYVLNNERKLESVPVIDSKLNNLDYDITIRGVRSETFMEVYDNFPMDLDVGWTEMVALNDKKLLMMVRDRGHALTIETTLNAENARVEYFIPKICNERMVNALPGVNEVNENSVGATGAFEVKREDLSSSLYNFISKVPMDKDIEKGNIK